ncbi:MAG: hypothetical protein IT548_13125 [Alphaproteobacteria bacterium]|nr:hypothetical protein [Alphaproteobacteria bacterium]
MVILGLFVSLVAAWAIGVRVFVIQPIGAIPDGATLVIYGAPGLDFIDSADAFCDRKQGGVSLLCRGVVIGGVAKNSTVLVRLPYMSGLYWLTGAPDVDR